MNLYFTGCEHLGHYNIIKYCDRPFKSVEEMDTEIIRKNNERINDDDICYRLGDFCFHSKNNNGNGTVDRAKDYIQRLNGTNIFLEGNHDKGNRNTLKTRNQEIILNQNGLRIQLLHDPLYARIDYDLIIHSHVHNLWKVKELHYCGQVRLMVNVGVDVSNFAPVKLDEVLSIYYRWQKERSKIKRWNKPEIIKELNRGTLSENKSI